MVGEVRCGVPVRVAEGGGGDMAGVVAVGMGEGEVQAEEMVVLSKKTSKNAKGGMFLCVVGVDNGVLKKMSLDGKGRKGTGGEKTRHAIHAKFCREKNARIMNSITPWRCATRAVEIMRAPAPALAWTREKNGLDEKER